VAGAWAVTDAVESDFVAHCFELVEGTGLGAFGEEPAEVVGPGILIERAGQPRVTARSPSCSTCHGETKATAQRHRPEGRPAAELRWMVLPPA
jgi:hypothetical protein